MPGPPRSPRHQENVISVGSDPQQECKLQRHSLQLRPHVNVGFDWSYCLDYCTLPAGSNDAFAHLPR